MKSRALTMLLVILSVLSLSFGLVACEEIDGDETQKPIEQACLHEYSDNFTCHDRKCTKCDYVLVSTTSHNYLNGVCDCNAIDESYIDDSLVFTLINNDSEYEVSGYTGSATRIAIPKTYLGKPVTSIGELAFYSQEQLEVFVVSDIVTSIGKGALSETSLKNIFLPSSVINLGEVALGYCPLLKSIKVSENNPKYKDIDGNLYTKDGTELIQYAVGKNESSFIIPNSVTKVCDLAFYEGKSLTNIKISNNVISIGTYAFQDCESLVGIDIPNRVTSIGYGAFWGCKSIESIEIPTSVAIIESNAFWTCSSLTSIFIPSSVTSMGSSVFYLCSSLTICCEAESQPSGWSNNWNSSNCRVVWGNNGYVTSLIKGYEWTDYGFAVGKNSSCKIEILNTINDVIQNIDIYALIDYYTAILESETPTNTFVLPDLSDNTEGTINVYTSLEFPPFEFTKGGEVVGVDMHIMTLACEKLNKKMNIIDISFDAICYEVANEDNAVCAAGLSITDERREILEFSNPYFTDKCSIVSAKDKMYTKLEQLAGKTVGVQRGSYAEILLNEAITSGALKNAKATLVKYDAVSLAYRDLQKGEIDAIIVDELLALTLVEN